MIEIEKLRLLNDDILVTYMEQQKYVSDIIDVINPKERQESVQYFKVVRVSPKVTDVKVGDTILLELGHHTIPFTINIDRYAITSVKEVIAVIE